MRLRSDIWVAAHLRRCAAEGVPAVLRRRGAAEAGAIYVKLDLLDGTARLFGPGLPSATAQDDGVRRFSPLHDAENIPAGDAEARMQREAKFDPDLWLIEIEDRKGRHFLEIAA